jgi:glucosamine 6-phosphate synthetase-like amidotransferase/phosphosugar isomerase protein
LAGTGLWFFQVDIASGYRYRDSVPHPNALVVMSQSGETADTLAALEHAAMALLKGPV